MTGFFFLSNMLRDGHVTVELKAYRFVFLFMALLIVELVLLLANTC